MAQINLETRMAAMEDQNRPKKRRSIGLPVLAGALALGGALGAYVLAANMQQVSTPPLDTSDVQDFQRGQGTGDRLTFETPEPEQRLEDALIRIEETLEGSGPQSVVVNPNAGVGAELAAMRQALADSNAGRDQAIAQAVAGLREAFEDRAAELENAAQQAERELANLKSSADARANSLQAKLDAERMQREALEVEMAHEETLALDAQRNAQAARDATELANLQILSPAVIYANSQSVAAAGAGAPSGRSGDRKLSDNEEFLHSPPALIIQQAEQLQDPGRTLVQGSVVQAALQVAINSDLPGNVIAVISEPVPSFAGDTILIPRGSRLFGSYSAGIEAGQKRILIVWSRILTPEGTSMQIASVGGDQLGRSGLTGIVDTKFAARFGGAALISLIGAGPSIASSSVGDDVVSDTLQRIAEDLEDTTGAAIVQQLNRKPTIYVDQGASVTVLVDRDVVIW